MFLDTGVDRDLEAVLPALRRPLSQQVRDFVQTFSFQHILRAIGLALLPSFLHSRHSRRSDPVHSTAWLDGLRGVACLGVCWQHMSYVALELKHGYGYYGSEPGPRHNLLQLPFVRVLYSGSAMVSIFFVISGYALSLKPLKLMHSHSYAAFSAHLSSAVFRRPIRLFLPPLVSTFCVMLLVQLNVYNSTARFANDKVQLTGTYEFHQQRIGPSFYAQLSHWAWNAFYFVYPWSFEGVQVPLGNMSYDLHMWTIPIEFRASMVMFLSHLVTLRMRPRTRLVSTAAMIIWAVNWARWEMVVFWAGMALAELDLLRSIKAGLPLSPSSPSSPVERIHILLKEKDDRLDKFARPPSPPDSPLPGTPVQGRIRSVSGPPSQRRHTALWLAMLVVGMYLASYPDAGGDETPGFRWMHALIPKAWGGWFRFWHNWGAILIVAAVSNCMLLQRLFVAPLTRWLGRISFAVYLVHGPVLHTFGYTVLPLIWKVTGKGDWGFGIGFGLAGCANTLMILWAGDIFWRLVDAPSVRLGRWLEQKLIA